MSGFSKEKFAANMRVQRARLGEKQITVAEAVGVDQNAISAYELGKVAPGADVLWRLADYYKVSIDELVGRES